MIKVLIPEIPVTQIGGIFGTIQINQPGMKTGKCLELPDSHLHWLDVETLEEVSVFEAVVFN